MKIAIQMEPFSAIKFHKSSSAVLMRSALARGWEVYHYADDQLSMESDRVVARAAAIVASDDEPGLVEGERVMMDLAGMDMVLLRSDPPFDMRYITTTYMLERLAQDTLVANNPRAVRDFPEKIFPFAFKQFMPQTIVSADVPSLQAFHKTHDTVILKPLNMFGGIGVAKFGPGEDLGSAAAAMIAEHKSPVVVQEYVPMAVKGDKRVTLINGEPVGAFLRVPWEGSVAANLAAGGSLHPCEMNARDREICAALGPVLKEHGLFICGIDILGDSLTEINVTSPIGFKELKELYEIDAAATLFDALEREVKIRATRAANEAISQAG